MESKKEQIVRFFASVSKAVQTWWPWLLDIGIVVFVAASIFSLMGCRSQQTAAYNTRTIKDSVAIRYKTVIRDSLRIKDSTVISYSTVQRDSIVMKVDNVTGTVLSKESWHWKDTDKDRIHITNVRNMAEKSDSVASTASKSDKQIIKQKKAEKSAEVKKTHYWKTYCLGILSGILLSFGWKYRKTVVGILKKIVRVI